MTIDVANTGPEPAPEPAPEPKPAELEPTEPEPTVEPPTPIAPNGRLIADQARSHSGRVLRLAATNPFAAIHVSRHVPKEVLHDAIVFNLDETIRRYTEPAVRRLQHTDAALFLAAFATSFHAGYGMGRDDAHHGTDWHEELAEQEELTRGRR